MEISNNLQLGAEYEDVITGFRGTATGFIVYISGDSQVQLTCRIGAYKGGEIATHWYETSRLRCVDGQQVVMPNEIE